VFILISSRSVHNIRVERMWVDVTAGFGSKWKLFFQDLQAAHGFDNSNNSHVWLVQFLYLTALNQDAQDWADAWNAHTMTLPDQRNSSPEELFLFGLVEQGERGIRERDALLNRPEEYGIDWAELERPAVIKHYLSRNYPPSAIENAFQPQPPSEFHHLHIEEAKCPLDTQQVEQMWGYLTARCDLESRDMGQRLLWWTVALEFCLNQ
jgi:hypothetical protein